MSRKLKYKVMEMLNNSTQLTSEEYLLLKKWEIDINSCDNENGKVPLLLSEEQQQEIDMINKVIERHNPKKPKLNYLRNL